MNMKALFLAGILLGACGLAACGPSSRFSRAQQLEAKGYFVEAGIAYEDFVRKYPQNALAPEALYRLGRIYQVRLKLFSQASSYFKKLTDTYPAAQPWSGLARRAQLDSPDYYPVTGGSFWIEGDSETGGRNMRSEWNCLEASSGTYCIRRRVSAGSQFVSETKRFYRKEDYEVRESVDPNASRVTVLLSYPYYEGKSWQTKRDGQALTFTIVSRNAALKTRAGEFANCLKISEENSFIPGSVKYNYYAPGVGWVLTTITSAGGREHKNTELLSYKVIPEES